MQEPAPPRPNRSTCPPSAATRSSSCVAATIPVPPAASSRSSATTSAQVRASCPKVGSSSTSTRGRAASTAPTDSRRCSPPDRVYGLALASGARPSRSSSSPTRASTCTAGTPARRGPTASSSATVVATTWCSGSWKTVPIRVTSSRGRHRWGAVPRAPAASAGAATTSPAAGGCRPARVSASVDLPEPLSPSTHVTDPAATARSTSATTGGSPARARERRLAESPRASSSSSAPAGAAGCTGTGCGGPGARTGSGVRPGTHTPRPARSAPRSANTRAGEPCAEAPPPGSRTTTRSASSTQPARRCSTSTQVAPVLASTAPTCSRSMRVPGSSSIAEGSSSSSSPGRSASTPASARRCRSPPDSREVGWSRP